MSWTHQLLKQLGDPRLEGIAALVRAHRQAQEDRQAQGRLPSEDHKPGRRILFRNPPPLDPVLQRLLDAAPPSLVIPDLEVWRALSETSVPAAPVLLPETTPRQQA